MSHNGILICEDECNMESLSYSGRIIPDIFPDNLSYREGMRPRCLFRSEKIESIRLQIQYGLYDVEAHLDEIVETLIARLK